MATHSPGADQSASPFFRLTVLTAGDARAGKSCLVKRFCEGRFAPRYAPTIGVDYGVRALRAPPPRAAAAAASAAAGADAAPRGVRVNFFDLAGGAAYATVRAGFWREAHGVALVFALDARPTFDHLDDWLREARDCGGADALAAAVLVGCRADAPARAVDAAEAAAWAARAGMPYFEASAAADVGVADVWAALFDRAADVAVARQDAAQRAMARDAAAAAATGGSGGGDGGGSGDGGGGEADADPSTAAG